MSIGVLINHVLSFLTSPIAVSLALLAIGIILRANGKVRNSLPHSLLISHLTFLIGFVWLWFMSSGLACRWLGLSLEREFPPQQVEALPMADAIVVLGGGVGGNTNTVFYTELYAAADRVAQAARIWKSGKAPVIWASGTNEIVATVPFLLELGVPMNAIHVENRSGNTEENARAIARELKAGEQGRKRKIILVTSAWHMRRALLMFCKFASELDVIPAACDYEATIGSDELHFYELLLPSADCLLRNSYSLKEIIGYWGYRLLR